MTRGPSARVGVIFPIVVLALALVFPAPAAAQVSRDRVVALLTKQLEMRGLAVENISRCAARRAGRTWVCKWHASGRDADAVPYDCRGRAVYNRVRRKWRIDECKSTLEPQVEYRDRVVALLRQQLEMRGLAVENISRCVARRAGRTWVCNWYAKGKDAGEVPYDCRGRAVYNRVSRKWRIDECKSILEPQIALQSGSGPHPEFGYSGTHFYNLDQSWYDLLDRSGATVARQGLAWSAVEASPGQYNWAVFDAVYQNLMQRGIRPLWILTLAPCWAQPPAANCSPGELGAMHPSESHYPEFAKFAAEAAKRYPGSIGFEVWNEANFDTFWGGDANVNTYSEMFKQVVSAIEAANPGMPVYTSGLSPHSNPSPEAVPYQDFIEGMYRNGAAQLADGVAIHPYPGIGYSEDPEVEGYIERVRVHMERVDEVMRRWGDGDTPMIVTEVGVSTTGSEAYTQEQQARALADIYDLFRRIDGVPMVIIHRFADESGATGDEGGFGVVTADGHPKDAFCALAQVRQSPC